MSEPSATPRRHDIQPPAGEAVLRAVAVVGLVIIALALAFAIIKFMFYYVDSSIQRERAVQLTEQTARAGLTSASIPALDISGYDYVSGGNLIGPRFEDIVVSEIQYGADAAGPFRNVTANAVYRNDQVSITMPITQKFTFDSESTRWVSQGDVIAGELSVSPTGVPSVSTLEADARELIMDYDASIAEDFGDAQMSMDPELTEVGGTVVATFSKRTKTNVLERSATLAVSWVDGSGWKMSVESVGDLVKSKPFVKQTLKKTIGNGATVRATGTIVSQGGRTFIKTEGPCQITMDGRVWNVEMFELTTTDPSVTVPRGEKVSVVGIITPTGSTSAAPLAISVTRTG